jgi:hypothetical protein
VRRDAAVLISVLYRLSSADGDDDDNGEDDEGDGEEEKGVWWELSSEGKRSFVALCVAKARGRGGERVRGRERRESERRERAFFRDLAAQLSEHDDRQMLPADEKRAKTRSKKGPTSRKPKRGDDKRQEAAPVSTKRTLETHMSTSTSRNPNRYLLELPPVVDSFELTGWRWPFVFRFLSGYFAPHFVRMLEVLQADGRWRWGGNLAWSVCVRSG